MDSSEDEGLFITQSSTKADISAGIPGLRKTMDLSEDEGLFITQSSTLIFNDFFKCINKVHQYQTRLANKISYYLPKARTNYGKFNIRFFGVKVWNSIEDSLKSESRTCFKNLLKDLLISNY